MTLSLTQSLSHSCFDFSDVTEHCRAVVDNDYNDYNGYNDYNNYNNFNDYSDLD